MASALGGGDGAAGTRRTCGGLGGLQVQECVPPKDVGCGRGGSRLRIRQAWLADMGNVERGDTGRGPAECLGASANWCGDSALLPWCREGGGELDSGDAPCRVKGSIEVKVATHRSRGLPGRPNEGVEPSALSVCGRPPLARGMSPRADVWYWGRGGLLGL